MIKDVSSTRDTSPLGHDWHIATEASNRGTRTAATCTTAGTYFDYCSRCNASDPNRYHSAGSELGHFWGDVTNRTDKYSSATYCNEKDKWFKHCSRQGCGVSARGIDNTQIFEGDAGQNHSEDWIIIGAATSLPTTMKASQDSNWEGKVDFNKAVSSLKKDIEIQIAEQSNRHGVNASITWSTKSPNNNTGHQYLNDPKDRYWEWKPSVTISGVKTKSSGYIRIHRSAGRSECWCGFSSEFSVKIRKCSKCNNLY